MIAKRTEKMKLTRMKHPEWYHCRVLAYYHLGLNGPEWGRISLGFPTWYGY